MPYEIPTEALYDTNRRNRITARSLLASFRWALEMHRRCNREIALGRQLDEKSIRRIAQQIASERPDLM